MIHDDDKYTAFTRFAVFPGDYVFYIYSPEMLNDDDISVLSPLHKYGYYIHKGQISLDENDNVGYIRMLKKALISCESMKEMVEFLLNKYKKDMVL